MTGSAEVVGKHHLRRIVGRRIRRSCWAAINSSRNSVSCTILWESAEVVIKRSVLLHGEDDVIDVGL